MDQLTRIEKLLERIAVALEKHGETKLDWPSFDPSKSTREWRHMRYDPHCDQWIDTKKSCDTEIKFRRDARGYVIKPEGTQTEMVKSDVKCTDWNKKSE